MKTQHLKTTDSKIIESYHLRAEATQKYLDHATEFKDSVHGTELWAGVRWGDFVVVGIGFDTPPSRWKKIMKGYAPYKNNPLHQEFKNLSKPLLRVAGIPELVMDSDVMYSPGFLLQDGALYVAYGGVVELKEDRGQGHGWQAIKPSKWHAALEARQEGVGKTNAKTARNNS